MMNLIYISSAVELSCTVGQRWIWDRGGHGSSGDSVRLVHASVPALLTMGAYRPLSRAFGLSSPTGSWNI